MQNRPVLVELRLFSDPKVWFLENRDIALPLPQHLVNGAFAGALRAEDEVNSIGACEVKGNRLIEMALQVGVVLRSTESKINLFESIHFHSMITSQGGLHARGSFETPCADVSGFGTDLAAAAAAAVFFAGGLTSMNPAGLEGGWHRAKSARPSPVWKSGQPEVVP
jgi:hypothetical protein